MSIALLLNKATLRLSSITFRLPQQPIFSQPVRCVLKSSRDVKSPAEGRHGAPSPTAGDLRGARGQQLVGGFPREGGRESGAEEGAAPRHQSLPAGPRGSVRPTALFRESGAGGSGRHLQLGQLRVTGRPRLSLLFFLPPLLPPSPPAPSPPRSPAQIRAAPPPPSQPPSAARASSERQRCAAPAEGAAGGRGDVRGAPGGGGKSHRQEGSRELLRTAR